MVATGIVLFDALCLIQFKTIPLLPQEHKLMILLLSMEKTNTTVAFYGENTTVVIGEDCRATFQGTFVTEEGDEEPQGDIMG